MKIIPWHSAFISALFCLGFITSSLGADWRPPILRAPATPGTGLSLDPNSLKLELGDKRERKYAVRIRGNFNVQDASLIWTTRFIKPGEDGSFELLVPVNGPITPVTLVTIDPYGSAEKTTYEILFDDWVKFQEAVESDLATSGTFWMGLGPTFISYQETGVPDYSSIVLTGKAGYSRPVFSPRWSAGLTGFATLIPLSENYSAGARFAGFNIRLGYHFLKVPPPWKIALHVGSYFTTMYVANDQFGFENATGPQLYPTVQRTLGNGHLMKGYFKLSPLATNDSGFSFGSRELAFGLEYVLTTTSVKPYSINFDYSNLLIKLFGQNLASQTLSLSLSHGF